MASTIPLSLFLALLFFFSPSIAQPVKRRALLPVTKDAATKQYITVISQRTPLVPVKLTVDLGGRFLWVDCQDNYVSSTLTPVICDSMFCRLSQAGACSGNCTGSSPLHPNKDCFCSHLAYNPFSRTSTGTELNEDVITLQDTNGSTLGPFLKPGKVVFGCADASILKSLAKGVKGIAGLGNGYVSIPYQLIYRFSRPRKIGLCLSSSTTSPGVIFFGYPEPYNFLPGIDVSKNLLYTPLLTNPISTAGSYFGGETSTDYFIGVKSIKVNGELVLINNLLLQINKETGKGGTKISTVDPYTVLETSIYKALVKAFTHALTIPRVKKVAPFEMCYKRTSLPSTRVGPGVPTIEFVLQGKKSTETPSFLIYGANSMVAVTDEVLCLGFVNGGEDQTTSIVIGGHQIEENLVQIDIDNKRVGFSNSLLFRQTTCANFNFGSKQGQELGGLEIM
uniref:Basic 7S globulin-like n=1 Tax=Nicotiana tabacum TaxID=4097 RepID=A0A1S3ZH17_TOBAC|nr:PREDICTED: basic 7S globulin-like [Nicotiana tabacum]